MKKTNNNSSDPWAALDALIKQTEEPKGPEWFYTEDFSSRYKLSTPHSHTKLKKLLRMGLVEQWKGRVAGKTGGICSKWRYIGKSK